MNRVTKYLKCLINVTKDTPRIFSPAKCRTVKKFNVVYSSQQAWIVPFDGHYYQAKVLKTDENHEFKAL